MTQYLKINIYAPAALEEELTMLLFDYGASGVAVENSAIIKACLEAKTWDVSVFEDVRSIVGKVNLSCALRNDPAGKEAAEHISRAVKKFTNVIFTQESLPDMDWQKKWKEGFISRSLGDKLWIRPCWDETPVPKGRVAVVIEPGMAFGTGDHATTAMMLELIEEYSKPGDKAMDFGCGSGILSIAALKLGGVESRCVDIDPICQDVVESHCRLNNITQGAIRFYCGDILEDRALQQELAFSKSQLVMANINANSICRLAEVVRLFLAPDGVFLCSGVVDMHDNMVMKAFAQNGLLVLAHRADAGWIAYATGVV